jgi:rRNA processing protein Gar1
VAPQALQKVYDQELVSLGGVSDVVRISAPYKLVSRQHHRQMTTVYVGDAVSDCLRAALQSAGGPAPGMA